MNRYAQGIEEFHTVSLAEDNFTKNPPLTYLNQGNDISTAI